VDDFDQYDSQKLKLFWVFPEPAFFFPFSGRENCLFSVHFGGFLGSKVDDSGHDGGQKTETFLGFPRTCVFFPFSG